MPAETIHTAAGAFAAGLAASLHCAGMCGPLACGLLSSGRGSAPADPQTAAALYHTGRLVSYATIGGLAGALGRWPLANAFAAPAALLPWALAAVLLVMAFGGSGRIPQPLFLKKRVARLRLFLCRAPAGRGALTLGLVTPLLPCGPLYLMFGVALLSGSAARGVEFMMAYALGTVPLLWLTQHGFQLWGRRLNPVTLGRVRRGAALAGAALLIARAWGVSPVSSSSTANAPAVPEVACPLCHES